MSGLRRRRLEGYHIEIVWVGGIAFSSRSRGGVVLFFLFFDLGDDGEKDIGLPRSDGRTLHGFAEEFRMDLKAEKTSIYHSILY